MDKNKIYLEFKDTKKELEFDLNKNTVFYGNNGQGKTRILKTINSLYLLAKEQKTEVLSQIIDSMNLKTLKVNNVNHTQLFSVNNKLKESEKRALNKFIEKNLDLFIQLSTLLHEFPEDKIFIVPLSRKFDGILNYLDTKLIPIGKNKDSSERLSIEGFNRWLNDTFKYIRSFKDNFKNALIESIEVDFSENFERKYSILEEAFFVISYLRSKRHNFSLDNRFKHTNSKSVDILNERNKILDNLSEKSSIYINTDNLDISNINKKLKLKIDKINSKLNDFFWQMNPENLIIEENIKELISERNEVNKKILLFNKIIKKYSNIGIDLNNSNGLSFHKNKYDMEFNKLSSGEQRITFLFLEILFNDVDIYLIDEPELSLSLNFQNKIITDLHSLTKNKTLFIATHAPYIYEDFIAINDNIPKEV